MFARFRSRWFLTGAAACLGLSMLFVGMMSRSAKAATRSYNLVYKAVTHTLDGQKFPFVATGTMTWDDVTGAVSFAVTVAASGDAISGTGTFGAGPKFGYATSSFDSGQYSGDAIISGKFNADRSSFKGKIYVGIPDRLAPAPDGFVFVDGKVTLTEIVE